MNATILKLIVSILMNVLPMILKFFDELGDDDKKSIIASLEKEGESLT